MLPAEKIFISTRMSRLSCRMGMGGNMELLDGKKWEWDLSIRGEWEWDGNEVTEMGGIWYENSVPTHLYFRGRLGQIQFVMELVCSASTRKTRSTSQVPTKRMVRSQANQSTVCWSPLDEPKHVQSCQLFVVSGLW